MSRRTVKAALCIAGVVAMLSGGSALAAACSGINVGTADTTDVTFAGAASDQCVISGVNPQAGPNGNTSGFGAIFPAGSSWSLLGKVTSASGSASLGSVNFTWGFTEAPSHKTGTWTLLADQDVTLDLVFAMHASNHSGAFLFDNQGLLANAVTPGTWTIEWLNNGGNVPDFSNLTLFARDVVTTPVPEPETYALMMAGLAALGFVARRRRRA